MKPPKSLYNLKGPDQMRAFRIEMFSYSVTREGIYPHKAEATLEQALIELREHWQITAKLFRLIQILRKLIMKWGL